MKNKITLISIFYFIIGISFYFIDFDFIIKNKAEYLIHIINFCNSIHFDFLLFENTIELPHNDEGSYTILPINRIIFLMVLLVGSIIYYVSNEKQTRLLRFALLFFFIAKALNLFFILLNAPERFKTFPLLTVYYLAIDVFWLFLTYKAIKYLNSLKELIPISIEKVEIKNEQTERVSAREVMNQSLEKANEIQVPFQKASLGDRFLNHLLDTFFIILIFSPYIFGFAKSSEFREYMYGLDSEIGESFVFFLFIALGKLIYFILSEGLFHISPAKALTETQVYSTSEKELDLTTIVGRTFMRLIPFDAFSFLGKKGWHDDLSKTTVLKNKQTENSKYLVVLFLFAIFVLSLINGLWDSF